MLDEASGDAREREGRLHAELTAQPGMPIVLFGAGNLGRRTLSLLRAHGRAAAESVDQRSRPLGQLVDVVQVLSPQAAASLFAGCGLAVVRMMLTSPVSRS